MSDLRFVYVIPDDHGSSWRHWQEIRYYGAWLRQIGDHHSNITIGTIPIEFWTKKERQRAREISNRYFAHSEGAPGPNGTVKVAYRYRKKVEHFPLSSKEVSDLRDEVLSLVSKQLEIAFEVTCGTCGESSSGDLIACDHVDYSGIDDREAPFEFIRPLNTDVIAIFYSKSDVTKGTKFTRSILMPTLAEGLDKEKLESPVGDTDTSKAWRDKGRICLRLFATDDTFVGTIRKLGLYSNNVMAIYGSS